VLADRREERDLDCQGEKFHATWLGKSSRISIVLLEWRVGSIEWVAGSGFKSLRCLPTCLICFFFIFVMRSLWRIYCTAYAKYLKGSVAS